MKVSDSRVTRMSLCKTKEIQNQTMQKVQIHFVNSVSVSQYLGASWVWQWSVVQGAQRSRNHPKSRTRSSRASTAQGSPWISAAVFFWEGDRASTQCPTALRGRADLLESAPGLPVPSSIVQPDIPWGTHCRPQRKPVPELGIQLPAPKLQMNALKARSFLFLWFLCTLPNRGGGSLWK